MTKIDNEDDDVNLTGCVTIIAEAFISLGVGVLFGYGYGYILFGAVLSVYCFFITRRLKKRDITRRLKKREEGQ